MSLGFIDLPLEELYEYQGRNPRPADFDQYWDHALDEMNSVESDIELVPAEFETAVADCSHLYFTGVGGARIHAKLLKPKTAGPHPAILMFHGYSMHSGNWLHKLGYVAQGFVVAALDCRGQGGLSEDVGGVIGNTLNGHIIRGLDDVPEKLLFRQIYLNTAQLAKIIMGMPDVDDTRVAAMGGSQGGGLTLACAALEPRIQLALPTFPFLSDYKRVWEMDLDVDAYHELKQYFRRFDPLHQHEDAIFAKLGYVDVQHLSPRIQAEVQLTVCLRDEICPPSTQFAAYNKITAPKSVTLYPDYAHETPPSHADLEFQWLTKLLK